MIEISISTMSELQAHAIPATLKATDDTLNECLKFKMSYNGMAAEFNIHHDNISKMSPEIAKAYIKLYITGIKNQLINK